jgi:hypothetical protein
MGILRDRMTEEISYGTSLPQHKSLTSTPSPGWPNITGDPRINSIRSRSARIFYISQWNESCLPTP